MAKPDPIEEKLRQDREAAAAASRRYLEATTPQPMAPVPGEPSMADVARAYEQQVSGAPTPALPIVGIPQAPITAPMPATYLPGVTEQFTPTQPVPPVSAERLAMSARPPVPADVMTGQTVMPEPPPPPRAPVKPQLPSGIASQFGGMYVPTADEFEQKMIERFGDRTRTGQPMSQQEAALRAEYAKLRQNTMPGIQTQMLESQLGGLGEQEAAMSDAAQRQAATLDAISQARTRAEAEARVANEELLKIQADKKRVVDAQTAKFERGVRDLERADIDPDRLWAKKGTGGTIMAGIGLILSAIGGGYTGQKSAAMEAINKQIDDDIEAQKANIQAKATALQARGSLLGHFMNVYGDREQAAVASRAYAYERVGQLIENIGLQSQSEQVRADALDASKQFKRQAEQMKLMNKAQALAGWQAQQMAAAQAAQKSQSLLRQPGWRELKEADANRIIPGIGLVHGSDAEVKQVRSTIRAAKTGTEQINALRAYASTAASYDPTDEDKARAGVLVKNLQLSLKESGGMGTLDKGSQEFLDAMVSNPADLFEFKGRALARLDMIQRGLIQGARNATEGLVVEPVQIAETQNAKGETVRVIRTGEMPEPERAPSFKPVE